MAMINPKKSYSEPVSYVAAIISVIMGMVLVVVSQSVYTPLKKVAYAVMLTNDIALAVLCLCNFTKPKKTKKKSDNGGMDIRQSSEGVLAMFIISVMYIVVYILLFAAVILNNIQKGDYV